MLQAVWIATSLTLALLVSPTLAFAHHDDIPDPPPRSVSDRRDMELMSEEPARHGRMARC
jgi:hypothetical protein